MRDEFGLHVTSSIFPKAANPEHEVEEDLRRLKRELESGTSKMRKTAWLVKLKGDVDDQYENAR
jgi:hypothetical protein